MPNSTSYRTILYHILAWAAFITYEVLLVELISPSNTAWWEWACWYTVNICLFYFFGHGVLQYTVTREKLLLLPLLIPAIIAGYITIQVGLENAMNLFRDEPKPFSLNSFFLLRSIWRCIYFIGFSTAYWFTRQTIKHHKHINYMELQRLQAEREKAELTKGLARSQNALLQAQISPHLLFNTLNFIYNSVQDVSPKASQGVLLLSEVMHYALQRVQEDGKTELQHEVEHIERYIALNQLRFSYPLHLQLKYAGQLQGRIPPLLLLTFVENIFKHGDLTDSSHAATIQLSGSHQQLHFSTNNKKRKHHAGRGYGIGIQNAKTRLNELYSEKDYTLTIQEDEQQHSVNLKIKLT
ncbi:sensor histidine kinase [Pontibacter litorisediminis]|uniref:sensor histidine kinase n=1 Tax=Pontibacter litorisediminis TaxID=1846260 RepID=UPI0023ED8655|nr:histidine kinase [Pontibacter litorisediminis]